MIFCFEFKLKLFYTLKRPKITVGKFNWQRCHLWYNDTFVEIGFLTKDSKSFLDLKMMHEDSIETAVNSVKQSKKEKGKLPMVKPQ